MTLSPEPDPAGPVRRAAVLGKPVAHSLSPVIHNAGYAALGLAGWSYTAIECSEAELPGFVASRDSSWVGLSLTMPLKEIALSVADAVSPVAAAIGAANTLVRRPDGGWYADNTDAPGLVDALRDAGLVAPRTVAVLGAGGTARAVVAAAGQLGATAVTVYVRRPEAGAALGSVATAAGVPLLVRPWTDAAEAFGADLVVSTVPAGVADSLVPAAQFHGAVFDVLYHPWPTPLGEAALAAGVPVLSGRDLLLAQGVRQFILFTGVDAAPVAAMRAALLAASSG
jgi:shikimate dehydrogenase